MITALIYNLHLKKRILYLLKKREGFFKRLKGTMGLNIKYDD